MGEACGKNGAAPKDLEKSIITPDAYILQPSTTLLTSDEHQEKLRLLGLDYWQVFAAPASGMWTQLVCT